MRYKDILSLARENPEIKSEILILAEEISGADKSAFLTHPEREIENANEFEKAFDELKAGRPLQYILGKWEFAGREYKVGDGVLIPREDTLAVIELSKILVGDRKDIVFADLGSGSGIIAVTLAIELNARGYAVEKSQTAQSFLCENIKMAGNGVTAVNGDMFEVVDDLPQLDLVVSNPPYIAEDEMKTLSKWVLNEPHEALFAEDNGLEFYRRIAKDYYRKLKQSGAITFEVGYTQADAVIEILKAEGYVDIREKLDLSGHRRAVGGIKR